MKQISGRSFSIPMAKANTVKGSIDGHCYGSGDTAIILSNMDTNDQKEWDPIIWDLLAGNHVVFTYAYAEHMDDQSWALEEVISLACSQGAKNIVLIGASRGGVASIKAAARHVNDDSIAGVVAISAPIEYEGTIFYDADELNNIGIPKLLLNSEGDGGASDNRKMMEMLAEPKELFLYPGDAHGTELFEKERESVINKMNSFIRSVT